MIFSVMDVLLFNPVGPTPPYFVKFMVQALWKIFLSNFQTHKGSHSCLLFFGPAKAYCAWGPALRLQTM